MESGRNFPGPILEKVLQSELDLPLRAGLGLERRARDCPEGARRGILIREVEVRVVGQVEYLRPELHALTLREPEGSVEAEVKVLQPVPTERVAPHVAE